MNELFEPNQPPAGNADKTKVTIYTRTFQFEGYMYTPRVGKEGRRLTQALNKDNNFITVTDVQVIDRQSGRQDPAIYPLIYVNNDSIEFIQPQLD